MRETIFIGALGLSDEQIDVLKNNIPASKCEIMDTEILSDIIAHSKMANVVVWDKLTDDEKALMVDFYTEIAPFSETMILIGDKGIPSELKKVVSIFESFDNFAEKSKYVFLNAYRKIKKNEVFSKTLSNCLRILDLLARKPYITTNEIAEKLERSNRTIQRYIETLRCAGVCIDYNFEHKGWELHKEGTALMFEEIFKYH